MSLNPFATVKDYPSMLNKIAIFTFFESIGATALLRWQVPEIETFLRPFSFSVGTEGLSFTLGTIFPAFVIAFISRVFKLHDKLSDLFKIRMKFDVQEILKPMALASGATLNIEAIDSLKTRRNKLMGDLFYPFASSTPGKAKIDGHDIAMALDQWTWYWVLLELNAVMFITACLFLIFRKPFPAAILLLAILIILWVMNYIKELCAKYALNEVGLILALDEGKQKQRTVKAFHEIQS